MDEFCDEHNVPKHLQEFLGLAGFYNVLDLTELTPKFVTDIEKMVRQRQFDNQVDFRLRENRMKYLGFDYTHLESFSFRQLDRMKLLRLSGLAQAKIAESGIKKEPSRASSRPMPKVSSHEKEEDNEDDDSWDEGPATKKRKSQVYRQKDSDRPNRVANKVVTEVNSVLKEKSFDDRIDLSHVNVSVDESGRLLVNVQCILCEPVKPIVLSANKYTSEINNWKRHLMSKHVGKRGII